jgi:hypothetical protein
MNGIKQRIQLVEDRMSELSRLVSGLDADTLEARKANRKISVLDDYLAKLRGDLTRMAERGGEQQEGGYAEELARIQGMEKLVEDEYNKCES